MVRVRVNDTDIVSLPESWGECTTRLALQLLTEWKPNPDNIITDEDRVKVFSIMTGKSYESLMQSTDYELEGMLHNVTRFFFMDDPGFTELQVPRVLLIGDVSVEIPKELGKLTIAQAIHVRGYINKVQNPNLAIALATAIYLQPLYDGRLVNDQIEPAQFSYPRAKQLEEKILDMPVVNIWPIGFFLLRQLGSYGTPWLTAFTQRIRRQLATVQRYRS